MKNNKSPEEKDPGGFPSHKPLPDFMRGKEVASTPASKKHPKRAFFHDYCLPGDYLITATALPGSPRLSEVADLSMEDIRKGKTFITALSPFGRIIHEEILAIPSFHSEMRIRQFVIMPDHIHIVLNVRQRLKRMLGSELAGFFGACSKRCGMLLGLEEVRTLFGRFHDRVIMDSQQLDRCVRYVEDNPRRYMLRKKLPDLFRRYLHLSIANREYAAFGNIFLLKGIYLLPVRIHRRWSDAEFSDYRKKCLMEFQKGAIPVTPAIHKAEKDIVQDAIGIGNCIILIREQGFEDRFKPQGKYFDLCAEGRLLLLAPWPDNVGRKSSSGYSEFHQMNEMAQAIATLEPGVRTSVFM